jgi:phage FluMu protein Com
MTRRTTQQENSFAACHEGALRCQCGNLLARLVPGGVEIKCRRCKRTVLISLDKNDDKHTAT